MSEIRITGRLQFHSETGTEGGYYAIEDERGTHGEVDVCPWGSKHCPGTASYWESSGWRPEQLGHSSYQGLFIMGSDGDYELTVYDESEIKYRGPVRLHRQANQYDREAVSVGGMVVHHIVEGQDQEAWADMFFKELPATLVVKNPTSWELEQVRKLEEGVR